MSQQLAIDFEQDALEDAPTLENLVQDVARTNGNFARAFEAMAIAEEEIERAQKTWPERADLIDRAFLVLRPRAGLLERGYQGPLLHSHMAALLARIGQHGPDADMETPTAAEVCTGFAEASLNAPLKHRHMMAYTAVFIDAFGEERAVKLIGEEGVRRALEDRHQHVIAEIIDSAYDRMRDEGRGRLWRERVGEWQDKEAA